MYAKAVFSFLSSIYKKCLFINSSFQALLYLNMEILPGTMMGNFSSNSNLQASVEPSDFSTHLPACLTVLMRNAKRKKNKGIQGKAASIMKHISNTEAIQQRKALQLNVKAIRNS